MPVSHPTRSRGWLQVDESGPQTQCRRLARPVRSALAPGLREAAGGGAAPQRDDLGSTIPDQAPVPKALWWVGSCSPGASGAAILRVRLAAVRCRSFLTHSGYGDASAAVSPGKGVLDLAAGRRHRNLSPPAAGVTAKHRP